MTDDTRWCPSGQHWRERQHFRVGKDLKIARDCTDCADTARLMAKAARALPAIAARQDGVDIDAIYFKRGAVAKHLQRPR